MVKVVRYSAVRRHLESLGWRHARTKGSHETWVGPDGVGRVTVPKHREVSAGVVRVIARSLPWVPPEWL